MPYYKVLGGRWGEGHEPGDVVEMDTAAACKRLEDGELEEVSKPEQKQVEVEVEGKECCGSKGTRCLKDCSSKVDDVEVEDAKPTENAE